MKYELVNPKPYKGTTLYQIKSLKDFHYAKKGELGGYIAKESNLSQEGLCWIWPDATAMADCEISGDAIVSGKARVSGNAKVRDKASVYGNAIIDCSAVVENYSLISDNTVVSGTVKDSAVIGGHCFIGPLAVVSQSARLSGSVKVYGLSEISGEARLKGNFTLDNALILETHNLFAALNVGTENGTLLVYPSTNGIKATRGCFSGTPEEFLAKSSAVHDAKTQLEYRLLMQVALSRLTSVEQT